MKISEQQKAIISSLVCERLSADEDNSFSVKGFVMKLLMLDFKDFWML